MNQTNDQNLGAVLTSLPHALDLLMDKLCSVQQTHDTMMLPKEETPKPKRHICPHKKTSIKDAPANRDRKSPWPMVPVTDALRMLIEICTPLVSGFSTILFEVKSPFSSFENFKSLPKGSIWLKFLSDSV